MSWKKIEIPADQPACPHMRIRWVTWSNDDLSTSGLHLCVDCWTPFLPMALLEAKTETVVDFGADAQPVDEVVNGCSPAPSRYEAAEPGYVVVRLDPGATALFLSPVVSFRAEAEEIRNDYEREACSSIRVARVEVLEDVAECEPAPPTPPLRPVRDNPQA